MYKRQDTYSGTVISSFDVDKPDKTIDAKCIMNNSGEVDVYKRQNEQSVIEIMCNETHIVNSPWSIHRILFVFG